MMSALPEGVRPFAFAWLLVTGCGEAHHSTPEGEPPAMPSDPSLCRSDPGLNADTVAATGYDGRYAEHPSASALRRATDCPQPAWRAMARPCDASWFYSPTSDEARLQLLWQAWCWHGVDLAVDGWVECDPDAVVTGAISGGTSGRFSCVVEYAGSRAERDVLRGRHTTDVIEAW